MISLLRPSLVRRVILAILGACLVLWLVLVAFQLLSGPTQGNRDRTLTQLGDSLLSALAHFETTEEATAVVKGNSIVANQLYFINSIPTQIFIQLQDSQGALLYSSVPVQGIFPLGRVGVITGAMLNGQEVRVFRGETPRWRLMVAQANFALDWLLWESFVNLAPYMLIAFLFVVAPISVAVYSGLRPLREMSQRIASRHPDDLSATGTVAEYEEMRPLQEALDAMLTKLRRKVMTEAAFVQEAAHELRTPMAVISVQAHVLAMAKDPAQRLEAEQRLDAAIARSSHLVGQLLQLSQVGDNRAVAPEQFDLAQEVRAELSAMAPDALQRQLDVSMEAPDTLPVHLELHTFKSIFQNLVSNAIRYLSPGNSIVVELSPLLNGVMLTVTDNGPGIPADQREWVFERFHRGKDHSAPGAGLGLPIVRQACQRLGGSVRLETGPGGQGCRFIVWLPTPSGA